METGSVESVKHGSEQGHLGPTLLSELNAGYMRVWSMKIHQDG